MKKDIGIYALILLAVFMLMYALARVYPYGIAQPDTMRYYMQGTLFSWTNPSLYDGYHPPLYSLLLVFFLKFSEPTAALYWFNTTLLFGSMAVVYFASKTLFSSRTLGAITVLLMFLTEAVLLRVPFYNLEVLSEPLYIHTAFIGVVLVLLRWVGSGKLSSIWGFAFMGAAVMTRRIGRLFILFWAPLLLFQLVMFWRKPIDRRTYIKIVLAFMVLVVPFGAWVVRGRVYVNSQTNIMTAQYYIWRMAKVYDRENMLAPSRVDTNTVDTERYFQGEHEAINRYVYESYLGRDPQIVTPEIAKMQRYFVWYTMRHFYKDYIWFVASDYMHMFNLQYTWNREYISYKVDPNTQYDDMRSKGMQDELLSQLYPAGTPEGVVYNKAVAARLHYLCCTNPLAQFVHSWKFGPGIALHVWAVCVAGVWFFTRKRSPEIAKVSAMIAGLLGMAFVHALITIMAMRLYEIRFSLPSMLFVHFALVLSVVGVMNLLYKRCKTVRT